MSDKPPPLKPPLLPQDWDSLIEDFQHGGGRLQKWTAVPHFLPALIDQALSFLLRKDFPSKIPLLIFLDEFAETLFTNESHLDCLLDALRAVIQAPLDGIAITLLLKEQFMVSATSIYVSIDAICKFPYRYTEGLVELLLTVIHRPNHGLDRHTRGIACECLRELEKCYPCLLSGVAGHLWSLCQSERTHACQSYLLLFTMVVHSIVDRKLNVSIFNTSVPLVPFNVPPCVFDGKEINSGLNYKELRRALAFLLESPQVLTPCGLMEFLQMIMPIASALELQASLLKVQFFGLIYSFDPLLCHIVLVMFSNFLDAFDGKESEIVRRLMLISKETQHSLAFRLLALHWLLGFLSKLMLNREAKKYKSVVEMGLRFYPSVFDPLALKALKLDLLALYSMCVGVLEPVGHSGERGGASKISVKVFEDGLVSVSAFKWLPPWSTETAVAFRFFHKFLLGGSSHSETDPSTTRNLMNSTVFHALQGMLVRMTLDFLRLVPVVVSLIGRLSGCQSHCWLGGRLLQIFDEHLLPKVKIDYKLVSYFPIFDRIAENDSIPPQRLLDLLTKFMVFLVGQHSPDTGLKSWSQGSKVLVICRTMLVQHHSSRLFLGLSRLLAFTCLYFPDLEVRDDARIYLRMLICIPGKKLKAILNFGEQFLGISSSTHSSSYFNVVSPRNNQNFKKSRSILSCIHLERAIPLLVKQSWALSLSTSGIGSSKPSYLDSIIENEPQVVSREIDVSTDIMPTSESERKNQFQAPLRVMDSKISETLGMLRRYFSCIPDFRHMKGLKVSISCSLRLESEPFNQLLGTESPTSGLEGVEDTVPAVYATVLKFSSSAPYGSIPSCHIPFLLGEPSRTEGASDPTVTLDIVPVENGLGEVEEDYKASVTIDLEPREPTPGLVEVSIEANLENGQIVNGQLQSITVGIEDMFQKAIVPSDVPEDTMPTYFAGLFDALWEACGASTNIGRETFPLKGSKAVVAINGTRSVKLLEVSAELLIRATEQYLAPFVISVVGEQLVNIVRDGGIIRNAVFKDEAASDSFLDNAASLMDLRRGPLHITYFNDEDDGKEAPVNGYKRSMGCFSVLIFLPPRFHLLFQMEVSDLSTLVRIRTDHWPCLAYVDDYLEALFST
ncbi:AP-5 complex subunit beta-1 [Euphorbia peplus]|nr:AP-5 complex subunit beta-1 [Euphorbia peplus]